MEKIIRIIIIISASLSGILLFLLGIRQIRMSKRPHFFIITLLIALTLAEYDIISRVVRGTNFSVEYAEGQNVKKQLGRMNDLNNTQEWKSFKVFWKELDQIVPKEKKDEERDYSHYFGEYFNAVTSERADDLRRKLEELITGLNKLEQDKKISSIEVELLEMICIERINYMSFGFTSMMTRMMPPPLEVDKESSIKNLEQKIDVLIDLRKKEKIDQEQFQEAISNIQEDIETFSILDTISKHYVRYYYYSHKVGDEETENMVNIAEKHITGFEKHYADYQIKKEQGEINNTDIQYKETKKAIGEVKEILPFLREIVIDLER